METSGYAALRIAVSAALMVLMFSCVHKAPQPTATAQGVVVPDADMERFKNGVRSFHRGEMDLAYQDMKAYLKSAPKGKQADEATLILGKVELYRRNYTEAEEYFVGLARSFPDSRHLTEARHLTGVAKTERNKASESDKIYQLEEKREETEDLLEKERVSEELVEAQLEEGALGAAFVEAHALWRDARQEDRERLAESLIDVIDTMNSAQLEAARGEVSLGSYPDGLILYRMAVSERHLSHWREAGDLLREFVESNPDHPLIERARQDLESIDGRDRVEPMKIGVLLPLSKRFARVRNAIELAARLAAVDSGMKLEFVFADSESDPIVAVREFEKLVLQEHVIAVIGPLLGSTSEAVAYSAEQYEVPLLALSPREGLPEIGGFVFRNAMTARMQAKAIVDHAWDKLEKRTFGILFPMHPYGTELANAFWDEVVRKGGWVTGVERYQHDETSFRKHIRNLVGRYYLLYGGNYSCEDKNGLSCGKIVVGQKKETESQVDFDALFIPEYAKQAGMIAPTIPFEEVEIDTGRKRTYRRIARKERHLGKKVPMIQLLGGNGWNSDRLKEVGGKWVEGSVFCDGFYPAYLDNRQVKDFVREFKKDYQRTPATLEAYAYDTVGLLSHLISSAKPVERASLQRMLLDLPKYEGVTGEMHFDSSGEIVNPLIIMTLKEGEILPVDMVKKEEGEQEFTEKELKAKETES